MKSKLFKCALSFALASALVFCTTLICYTQIDNCASADRFSDYLSTFVDSGIKNHGDLTSDFLDVANLYLEEYNYVMRCNFPGYEKSLTDIPIECFKRLNDGTAVLVPFIGCYYYIKNGIFMLNNGGFEKEVEKASFSVSSADFKEAVEEANTQYSPKNAIGKMSYRTDKRWHEFYSGSSTQSYNYLSFYTSSNFSDGFTAVNGGDDMYTLFFYTDGTDTYYSRYQFHWVVNPLDPQYDSSGENIVSWGTSVDLYYWDCLDSSETDALYKNFYKCVSCNNYSLQVKSNGYFEFLPHDNYSGYLSFKRGNTVSDLKYISITDICDLTSPDLSTSIKLTSISTHFKGDFSAHDSSCSLNGGCDYGYIASSSPIQFTYLFDTSKIPDNYYVTITGDTIYDYSITNPETGQSDTINNYITNNYTYVTNNNGGENSGGSGGSAGGNVTVGGQIDVSGNVGVDVNVNINNGDNGGENIGDYIDASGTDVDVGGVLGKLPELSKGFVDYLKGFFAWLPAEIYSLIILILVISVWNVFRSRR